MDGLSVLSPASRERSLDDLPRKELQQLAKEAGVKGNIKSKDIVQSLLRCLEGQEAVPGTVKKAHPATSTQPLARTDTNDSLGAESNASDHAKQLDNAMDAAAQQSAKSNSLQDSRQAAASSEVLADDPSTSLDGQQPPAPDGVSAAEHLSPAVDPQSDHASNKGADEGCETTQEEQQADPQPSEKGSAPLQSPAVHPAAASASPDAMDATEQIPTRAASPTAAADVELASTSAVAAVETGRVAASQAGHSDAAAAAAVAPASEAHADAAAAAVSEAPAEAAAAPAASEAALDGANAAPVIAAGGDCVSNPLYEEPEDLRPVPQAAAQPSLLKQDAQGDQAAATVTQAEEDATGPSASELQPQQQEVTHSCDQDTDMGCANEADAAQQSVHATSASEAESQQHSRVAMPQEPKGQPVRDVTMSEAEEEQQGREPTPEGLANLGKAVDLVQAQSCQLSPSLLTVGQAPPGVDSPAQDAFERGRKSGIWQGSTEVELRQLERQWDDYKSVATRGWDLPNLQEVQAKSDALEASGFATVHSPLVSQATKQAMAKQRVTEKGLGIMLNKSAAGNALLAGQSNAQPLHGTQMSNVTNAGHAVRPGHSPRSGYRTKQKRKKSASSSACVQVSKGGKRKARGEEGEEGPAGSKQSGPSRKAVKRAQGHTPSRKGPGPSHKGSSPGLQSHGTPLRHANSARGPSRLAQSTHAADLENTAKAANSTPAAQGGEGKVQGSPFCAGVANRDTNAGARASKATGIPKPRPAIDRAKKAEATFAARRAAALAKVKK